MTEERRRQIECECATRIVNVANCYGGILKVGETAKLEGEIKHRFDKANEAASKFKDKNGRVDPTIQAIYARMYGLI